MTPPHPIANPSQTTNEGYYWYSIPFTNYAYIDEIMASGKKLWIDNNDKLKELQENFKGTYTTISKFVLELQPELSVLPEPGTVSSGDRYRVYQRFHIKPDKAEEFMEITKEYIALRKKQGVTANFYTRTAAFGHDLDISYFIDEMGENPAEHFTQNEKFWQETGEEGSKLWQKVAPLTTLKKRGFLILIKQIRTFSDVRPNYLKSSSTISNWISIIYSAPTIL